ncbi:MAG: class I SAM-dependent methyltransferase [Ignavibacteriales bacterium]|nr:class I SAM-dependent methyltransferase [Ignavibacteriales bacterium]MCB9211003.1 class I SAM-dependent methyltransferase [Ignavibacteriales bacterium]
MIEEIESEQADIETSSENYTTRFSGKVGEYFLNVQTEITLDLLKDENVKSILDVGGGHAQLAVPLVNKGYNVTVTGSDIVCRKRLDKFLKPNQFKFEECNFLNLPFPDNSFDAVICFRLLTHEKNWLILIKEMCRVSKNLIIIDYPDIRSFNVMYKIMFNFKKQFEKNTRAFRSFSRSELKKEFTKHDFIKFDFRPQYFLPMVVHRALKHEKISRISENIFKFIRLQYLFGTPVILKIKINKQ